MAHKKTLYICQRKECLPAAEAFASSNPAERLGEPSHNIKKLAIG